MSCCCEKVYRLCDFLVCGEDVVLPITVATDGDHTMELEYLGQMLRLTTALSMGDAASFPTADLNESFTYVGHLLDPNGAKMTFTVEGVVYDCFEFTTKKPINVNY